MKPIYLRTGGGLLIILAGVLLLLQNLNVLPANPGWLWGIIFLLAGLMFIAVFITNSQHWWALFPGMPLLAVGILTGAPSVFPSITGSFGGAFFMGMISLAFWLVFFANRNNWWAIIPGGILLSIATMIALSEIFHGGEQAGFLFFGMGLTFLVLYFVPTPRGRQRWAIFPAIPLLLMGLVVTSVTGTLSGYIWPLFLVGGGAWILWRSLRPSASATNSTVKIPQPPPSSTTMTSSQPTDSTMTNSSEEKKS